MKPSDSQDSHVLPKGTELPHNLIIHNVLGEGGFGITYSGTWNLTGEKVAIKEYFPTTLAHRTYIADTPHQIVPFHGMEDSFEKGRQHFLNEAIILKEFQNLHSIVAVKDVIETNGTVYLVMEFIDGITLKQYVQENGVLSFQELLPLLQPVILSLTQIHKKGLIHRDISPDNLMLGVDNQLHLIDFGAASIENTNETKNITVILKSGYAPPEQYLSDGKQGAWTDVYALCSTIYMLLTGFDAPESIRRIQEDTLLPLAEYADITDWQAAAIEKGMRIPAADRFQDMESLYQALIIPPLEMIAQRTDKPKNSIQENKTVIHTAAKAPKHHNSFVVFFLAFLLVALFSLIVFLSPLSPFKVKTDNPEPSTASSQTETEMMTTQLPTTEAATTCSMPDFVGHSLKDAKKQLNELDSSIKVETKKKYSSKYEKNTIIKQDVKSGTSFIKGSLSSILLTVSKGEKPTTEATTQPPVVEKTPVYQQEQPVQAESPQQTTPPVVTEAEDDSILIPEDDYQTIIID